GSPICSSKSSRSSDTCVLTERRTTSAPWIRSATPFVCADGRAAGQSTVVRRRRVRRDLSPRARCGAVASCRRAGAIAAWVKGQRVMAAPTAWVSRSRRAGITSGAIGLVLAQLAAGWLSVAPAIGDDDVRANRIRIEYESPRSAELQPLYELVKQREVLQRIQEIFSPLKLPIDIIVQA